ncbi:DUF2584 family protein [Metabacillus fastidiosus]|uniref:DUF2584 family protein n=1 Tax=Metabacillus fastidiosus TaxID=1458 RepID=UPI002E24CCF9|nr:DUF2584 family protein [Metabacillus fastidiosus]
MGMPMEFNTMIVTKGNEKQIQENVFQLKKEGLRIYPMNIPIEVRKIIESETIGQALVIKIELENEQTVITYKFITGQNTHL